MTDIEKEFEYRRSAARWKGLVYGVFIGIALVLLIITLR
jgi:hypothetical protein